ncbi:MAG TPA: hypothetical protein VGA53_01450 [Candidatus Paceibacterota bacterium]
MNKCWTFLLLGGLGIGVSPAEIEIAGQVEWPYTVPITVTNFSDREEQFEVFGAQANPGRFSLGAGESRQVAVNFDQPAEGVVKVLSMRTSAEGLSTGTGVKIPFRVADPADSRFLASANDAVGVFPYIFGTGVILVSLLLLWYIAGIIKLWLATSNKQ